MKQLRLDRLFGDLNLVDETGTVLFEACGGGEAMEKLAEQIVAAWNEKHGMNGSGNGEDFAAFWSAYPRKVGKDAALKAWKKRNGNLSLPAVLKAIAEQRETDQWKKDGGKFIPHPATWLNQGRWQDDVSTYPTEGPTVRQRESSGEDAWPSNVEAYKAELAAERSARKGDGELF